MKYILELAEFIKNDLLEVIRYLPGSVVMAVLWTAVFLIGMLLFQKRMHPGRVLALLGGFLYVVMLLQITYFSREWGERIGLYLGIFDTWGTSVVAKAYFIENILLFIPFGILVPCQFFSGNHLKSAWGCVGTGFLFSLGLELLQLVTERGFCQSDDVMTNTFGTLLGWCVYKLAAVITGYIGGKLPETEKGIYEINDR